MSGDGEAQWTASPTGKADPIAILRDGSADRRRLRARAPGKTAVTVALGDVKTSVDIEVVP